MTTDTPATDTSTTASGTEVSETFQVLGMTCDHCARAVTQELDQVAGVTAVRVDVPRGEVTVTSTAALTTADVRAAIVEAGYRLV